MPHDVAFTFVSVVYRRRDQGADGSYVSPAPIRLSEWIGDYPIGWAGEILADAQ